MITQRTTTAALALMLISAVGSDAEEKTGKAGGNAIEVYRSDLSKRIDLGVWSRSKIFTAPAGGRNFLGEYSGQGHVPLSLKDLPAHKFIRLRSDLIYHKSADGNGEDWPDIHGIMVEGGAALALTTFCNPRLADEPGRQSYPDEWPFGNHKAGTGGELAEFGFETEEEASEVIFPTDLTFPHTGSELTIRFFSKFRDTRADEAWGIAEVVVEAIPEATSPGDSAIEKLWERLLSKDPVDAERALWEIVAAGRPAAEKVEEYFATYTKRADAARREKATSKKGEFEALIRDLESDEFRDRQAAIEGLDGLDASILPLVEDKLGDGVLGVETRVALGELREILRRIRWIPEKMTHSDVVSSRVHRILRIYEGFENGYRITLSHPKKPGGTDSIGAPADGLVPRASVGSGYPRLTWFPAVDEAGWLQDHFPKARTIGSADVFWYRAGKVKVPQRWKIQFLDGAEWKDVDVEGVYRTQVDTLNRVRFEPVTTRAVRLAFHMKEDSSVGVYEFRVGK